MIMTMSLTIMTVSFLLWRLETIVHYCMHTDNLGPCFSNSFSNESLQNSSDSSDNEKGVIFESYYFRSWCCSLFENLSIYIVRCVINYQTLKYSILLCLVIVVSNVQYSISNGAAQYFW